jgi:hypothetical protein
VFVGGGGWSNAVVWRMRLADLAAGGNLPYSYVTSSSIGNSSYRLTQEATSTMYWAAHNDTSSLRIYRWPDSSSTISWDDESVSSWTAAMGACRKSGEIGFAWHVGPRSGRPNAYVRVARFRESDRALLGQTDVWSSSWCFAYPALTTNGRGDVGFVAALGRSTTAVSCAATIVDGYQPWGGLSFSFMRTSTVGPGSNRFGDYFWCERHPVYINTFIGTGNANLSGGADPRFTWFGREEVEPAWVHLDVQASGAGDNRLAMTLDRTDRNGANNGTTPFTRQFVQTQDYTLTAPLAHTWSNTFYVFDRWSVRDTPTSAFKDYAIDQRTLSIPDIGAAHDTAMARYLFRRAINVQSMNASGVPITVSRADVYNLQNGATNFTRYYKSDPTPVVLTAPATHGGRTFYRWRVASTFYPIGQRVLSMIPTGDRNAIAEYRQFTAGNFRVFGTSCQGSNGFPTQKPSGGSEIGNTAT